MNKKYEFTGEVKEFRGRTLRRIRRIEDGLIGGWIEDERNLSHEGNCFVYDNAMVYGDAEVRGNAVIYNNARVCDDAVVYDYARVCGDAVVYDYAMVYDNAMVHGNAMVCNCATICNNAIVCNGRIVGQIYQPYKNIFQCQCINRVLTAILTENDEILYNVGCQSNMTKEIFLDRIYNEGGGLKENPHREEYLKLIPLIESYFEN